MHFEDYNYEMYNKHVLINPDVEHDSGSSCDEENVELHGYSQA